MADPSEAGGPVSIPLAGNSGSAKKKVAELVTGQQHGHALREQQRGEQVGDAAETGVGVALELVTVLERPHDRPDPEGDDGQHADGYGGGEVHRRARGLYLGHVLVPQTRPEGEQREADRQGDPSGHARLLP